MQETAWTEARRGGGEMPLIIGHRGASARAPENSLEAFRRATLDGADGVELDVLCCATGEVVVFHDDDLRRLGERPDRIDALPFAALREVRLRSGVTIPTLDEAFEACGPSTLVNVELKAEGALSANGIARLVHGVAESIRRAGAERRALVSSFSPRALWTWRRHHPEIPIGLLFEREAPLPLRRGWPAALLRPWAMHPQAVLCDPSRVKRWHAGGRRVHIWTVDDASELRRFAAMGVDGIITNDPGATRAALSA